MISPEEDNWWEREPSFEELEANAKIVRMTPYGLRDGNGVDISLIESELRTPLQIRLRRADAARKQFERMHGRVKGPQ